ncbi:MAG: choice-of-anchor Q domain-containing protein, partial [Pseudolysinimonas sp.]
LTVARSSFVGNSFTSGGGSLFISAISDGTLLVDSSTFSGAVETGGGPWFGASIQVASLEGEFDILNSTMDETVVANGSAVSVGTVSAGTVNIAHSSIRGPGGVSIENNDSTTNPRIENSVLESTGAALALALDTSSNGARVQLKYSILNTNLAGLADDVVGNLLATDPQLGALANNGGPRMFTRLPLAGSPAINAGDPAYSGNPAFDERGTGFARLQGTRIDIGAAEVKPALAATGSTVSWWVIAIAAGVVILGVVTLILSRRARSKIEA